MLSFVTYQVLKHIFYFQMLLCLINDEEVKQLGFKAAIGPKSDKKLPLLHSVATLKDALNTYLSK